MNSRYYTFIIVLLVSLSVRAYKLTPYIPKDNPTGTGVIVCPGGSYCWLDKKGEGENVARWLNSNGIAAFVLEYSHAGWASFAFHVHTAGRKYPAGFNDLCDALDSVRVHADEYGVRKDRIGCMGFSAGGHLVMNVAEQLAGKKEDLKEALSLEKHVPAECPPVFLMNCDDDPIVHYHNAEMLDSALTAQHIPHQYEHYRTGGHGFGVSPEKTTEEAIQWKTRFLNWLYRLLDSDKLMVKNDD